ncbi:uncharacterized protein LOC141660501 [Apium graveolens]|uniref:uncharacterized protein LOC141660501 n=1 Tax=Apium graveolens TaxID=4045 RepID=UPI003D7A0190
MYKNVVNCTSAKQIWDTIEVINEGTEEVRENRLEILISQYKQFRSNPSEGISEVFQRLNKLVNDLNLNGKTNTNWEINRKFLFTLPEHLEHRVAAIRESRDMSEVTLERIYEDGEFYSMEELDQLEDESLALFARKFGNMRFRRNTCYKVKPTFRRFQKGGSLKNIFKSGYKTGLVDRSKFRCFNCNELGHFATECKKPKQQQGRRKDSYEELKEKYDALMKKHQGKSYLTEGRSWDDSDNNDEEEVSNLALLASSDGSLSPTR